MSKSDAGDSGAEDLDPLSPGPSNSPAKEKRAPRACLACRLRKSKCNLDHSGVPGKPPCLRCVRENRECVLTVSRRGGRRVRKSAVALGTGSAPADARQPGQEARDNSNPARLGGTETETFSTASTTGESADSRHRADLGSRGGSWQQPVRKSEGQSANWDQEWRTNQRSTESSSRQPPRDVEEDIDSHITSADLLNPSDALELLAQVAGRESEEDSRTDGGHHRQQELSGDQEAVDYPPLSDGHLSPAEAQRLIQAYQEKYHHFFPIAHHKVFKERNIFAVARDEPHLLTAILIVASKSDPSASKAHAACSTYMETLISSLIYRGSSSVGAVEALLIIAEWAPQPLQSRPSIGRGEEDQGAWMHVGCAIRLGYLQRLEQSGFLTDKKAPSEHMERAKIVWNACYMSDRQISIRLGKGFWSRGFGPTQTMSNWTYPTLTPQAAGTDDLSLLFKAHLELTQLFGNSHDVLYASATHREHLYAGGEYVRYIDDFASMLRTWKLVWGNLSFTPHVKATLMLSYDFLRLYINAFAFQAEMYRATARARRDNSNNNSSHTSSTTHNNGSAAAPPGPLFSNVAGAPDARFIYESIDAANSLISTLNSYIDPVSGLRYMPLKYYLYIIYAAVFLFKARLAGAISVEGGNSVRRAVSVTIDRLQKSSTSHHGPGYRYARLLYLLWHKPREKKTGGAGPGGGGATTGRSSAASLPPQQQQQQQHMQHSAAHEDEQARKQLSSNPFEPLADSSLNDFSWRDLGAVSQFITNDTGMADNLFSSPDTGLEIAGMTSSGSGGGAGDLAEDWYDFSMGNNDVIF